MLLSSLGSTLKPYVVSRAFVCIRGRDHLPSDISSYTLTESNLKPSHSPANTSLLKHHLKCIRFSTCPIQLGIPQIPV
jgi:hypothetical protein